MNPRNAVDFVAYYRVSTDRQGKSGLGLDAQRKAVADYLNGGAWDLIGEFTEVRAEKISDRPQLATAIEACRKHRARLVIAKLDRLSRNLAFIATLMNSGIEFVAADMPFATSSPSIFSQQSPSMSGRQFRNARRRRWRPPERGESGWATQTRRMLYKMHAGGQLLKSTMRAMSCQSFASCNGLDT